MNTTAQKNELIFGYSSGNYGEAKSLFTSMYLYLNSFAAKKASVFDNMLAQNFSELDGISLKKLKYTDCIKSSESKKQKINFFKEKVIKTFIHGFLHLLSFDHVKLGDYKKMLNEEQNIYRSVIKKID